MTKLIVRLRDGDATDAERWLLDSATDDVPPPRAREHTLAMLGLAGSVVPVVPGVLAATAKATSPGGATATLAAGAAAKTTGSIVALSVLKWLGTGAIVGVVAAGGVAAITTPGLLTSGASTSRQAPDAPLPSMPSVAVTPHAAAVGPREETPLRPVDDIPSTVGPAPHALPDRSGVGVSPEPARDVPLPPLENASGVVEQVAALDRARAALAAGDPRGALARLAENERAFPGGVLEPEAVVLRVRAWLELGQGHRAAAIAEQFLALHPGTPQGARLRALIGSAPP